MYSLERGKKMGGGRASRRALPAMKEHDEFHQRTKPNVT